jgi:hypothetical protein
MSICPAVMLRPRYTSCVPSGAEDVGIEELKESDDKGEQCHRESKFDCFFYICRHLSVLGHWEMSEEGVVHVAVLAFETESGTAWGTASLADVGNSVDCRAQAEMCVIIYVSMQ